MALHDKCASARRTFAWLFFLVLLPFVAVSPELKSSGATTGKHSKNAVARFVSPSSVPPGKEPVYTISINVEQVVLPVTVRDRKGGFVSGLHKDAFRVYENGVPQQIEHFSDEDVPVAVGLVVDNSGSMRPKHRDVVAAALAFARSSNPEDEMFVVNFNESASMGLPDNTPFTSNVAELESALSNIASTGRTALYDAIAAALEHLKPSRWDKKVLIVISDGGDNASRHNLSQIMAMANQSNAIIYTIGLFDENDNDQNPRALKQLAKATGGEAYFPNTVSDVVGTCERIARDIRNQYRLVYAPTNKKQDAAYRTIRVTVAIPHHRRLLVRTRAGYIAAPKAARLCSAQKGGAR